MLTIEDIRNPARKSGFRYVSAGGCGAGWQGSLNGGGRPRGWRGPLRKAPEVAAQDYCNHYNGLPVALRPRRPKLARMPALNLKRANHPARPRGTNRTHNRSRVTKPANRIKNMIGTVYLIGEVGNPDVVKVGWSKDSGFARLRELQTGNPRLLCGLGEFPGTKLAEYKLHLAYEPDSVLNEWFEVSPELLKEFDVSLQEFESAVGVELEAA